MKVEELLEAGVARKREPIKKKLITKTQHLQWKKIAKGTGTKPPRGPIEELKALPQPIGINGGAYTYWVDVTKSPLKFVASDGSELDEAKTLKDIGKWMDKHMQEFWNEFLDDQESLEFLMDEGVIRLKKGRGDQQEHEANMRESKAGVKVAQSKGTQKKLRDSGMMEKPGHYHKKGEDWESTKVVKPKKLKEAAEKKQPNVPELKQKALEIMFKLAEKDVKEYGQTIIDGFSDMDFYSPLNDLYEPYEWTKELERMDDSLKRSGAAVEKMFKEKYGMSSQKWLDAEDKKELDALPENERNLLKKIGSYLSVTLSPSDLKRGRLHIYKQSKTGLGVDAFGMETILRPLFFERIGMTMEEGTAILQKMGASMKKRPKRMKYSPSLYD